MLIGVVRHRFTDGRCLIIDPYFNNQISPTNIQSSTIINHWEFHSVWAVYDDVAVAMTAVIPVAGPVIGVSTVIDLAIVAWETINDVTVVFVS